ncbi:MAG: transposase [Steroidobacteraceae bacterium]
MPRPLRLHVNGGFYHVILRGNHREAVFRTREDRMLLSELVAETIDLHRMRIHAFCWMTNHMHFLVEVSDAPLGPAMRHVASRYARTSQWHRETTGHLFERRYRAILVDSERYLCELLRYIHLNPVRAGVVADPVEYEWSGHRAYLGLAQWNWLTTSLALTRFDRTPGAAREAYRRFVLEGIAIGANPEYSRGRADDPRLLGDDLFVARMTARTKSASTLTVDALIAHLCGQYGTDPSALSGSGRQRELAQLRVLVVHHAQEKQLATVSELARRFGRSVSTLAESLAHYRRERPELFQRPLGLQ